MTGPGRRHRLGPLERLPCAMRWLRWLANQYRGHRSWCHFPASFAARAWGCCGCARMGASSPRRLPGCFRTCSWDAAAAAAAAAVAYPHSPSDCGSGNHCCGQCCWQCLNQRFRPSPRALPPTGGPAAPTCCGSEASSSAVAPDRQALQWLHIGRRCGLPSKAGSTLRALPPGRPPPRRGRGRCSAPLRRLSASPLGNWRWEARPALRTSAVLPARDSTLRVAVEAAWG
mmetsp:Transcript_26280/g.78554  ORF Transcript_26280/g.78554 Transcript_26280/m.78554 type:complete len:229 (+) Transcript_26280:89-775(+)